MIGRRVKESSPALWIALVATAVSAIPLCALAQSYGTELPFVVGTGARSSGLGVAAMTLADDASVQYYNPSGLGYLQWKEFVFYRTTLFDSQSLYHAVSYAHPLVNHGTLAISLLRVDTGGIEERDATNQLLSTDLHNAQTRILLGYARTITPSIAAGLNIKLDNQSFGEYSASAAGMDIGFLATRQLPANSFVRTLRGGFAVRNVIEPSLKLDREAVPDPMDVAFGISALSGFGNVALVTTFDVVSPRHSPLDFRFGQEVSYEGRFALRAGLDDVTPTFGLGARFRQFALDYAYRNQDIGDNHRISLSVRFGASVPEQRARAREKLESEVGAQIATRMADMERANIMRALSGADSLRSAGDYENAIDRYETVLLWDVENADAKAGLAGAHFDRAYSFATKAEAEGNFVEGIFYSNQALSFVPADPAATALRARCNEKMKAAENNQALLNKLLKTSIDLYAERRFAEALAGFEQVLDAAPNSALAIEYADKCRRNIQAAVAGHRAEAEQKARRGDFDGAVSALEAARRYAPDDPSIKKDIERYRTRSEATASVDDRFDADAASATTGADRADRTVPALDKALDERYRKGMGLFNAGDFDGAIASLLQVWTVEPDYYSVSDFLAKAYIFVGMRYYSENKHAEAIETWRKALNVDPANSKAKRYLAKAEEELQKLKGVSRAR